MEYSAYGLAVLLHPWGSSLSWAELVVDVDQFGTHLCRRRVHTRSIYTQPMLGGGGKEAAHYQIPALLVKVLDVAVLLALERTQPVLKPTGQHVPARLTGYQAFNCCTRIKRERTHCCWWLRRPC